MVRASYSTALAGMPHTSGTQPRKLARGSGQSESMSTVRKRRSHKNSRSGCANCKLRSIKCDEGKPSCHKCKSFRVRCNYNAKSSTDALSAEASFQVDLTHIVVPESPAAPMPLLCSTYSNESYQLVSKDIKLVEKFQSRYLLTFATPSRQRICADNVLHTAFSNPVVMHAVLALTQIHDSTMNLTSTTTDTLTLTYHWYHAVSLLNDKMSKTLIPSERDAVYISGVLISLASFATIEATKPSEAWPLRPSSDLDLSWLKLCDGKAVLANLTDPLRPDGCFRDSAMEFHKSLAYINHVVASPTPDFSSLPPSFLDLFFLSDVETRSENPYYKPMVALSEIWRAGLSEQNFLLHVSFVGVLDERFRVLLRTRDEKALLLLLYWYVKVCDRRLWWLWKQAWTEGLAICEVLGRAWVGRGELLGLLEWPVARLTVAAGGRVLT